MKEIELSFADDEHGNPVKVPGTTTKLLPRKHRDGPGRRANVCLDGKALEFPVTMTASDLAILPSGDYDFLPVDDDHRRVGKGFLVSVLHVDGKPASADATQNANEASDVHADLIKSNEQLRTANRELQQNLLKAMDIMRQGMQQMTEAHVEITKQIGQVVEASAHNVQSSHGAGLSRAVEDIRHIWDAMPEGSNNLETVLSSPLVIGAVSALQKHIANAAQNTAEDMAGGGERRETEAARMARALFKAQAAAAAKK